MNMVRTGLVSDVLLIDSNNPPINAGSLGVRQGLSDAIAQLAGDPVLRAEVIIGGATTFLAASHGFSSKIDPTFSGVAGLRGCG